MDDLGDRMKLLEGITDLRVMPLLPVCVRLDGRSFHALTRDFDRPFDQNLKNMMEVTSERLLEAFNANLAYTQSDEISLIFLQSSINNSIIFSGRIQKICSVFASFTSATFNKCLVASTNKSPDAMFDCRTFHLPSLVECANYCVWREQDAVRNSIQMAARSVFSHKECNNKNSKELQEMLFQRGINWNDYPSCFKRGTYIRSKKVKRKFTAEELDKLPERHDARKKPDLEYDRTDTVRLNIPVLTTLPLEQRVEMLFG